MKKQILNKIIIGMICCTFLTNCVREDGTVNKAAAGTMIGATAGALLGSGVGKGSGRLAGVAVGTMIGAYFGNEFGRSLDKADRIYHNKTIQQGLENNYNGEILAWKNPENNHEGFISPVRTYRDSETHKYCREYRQKVIIGEEIQEAYGTACRNPDGQWEIIK